MDEDAAQPGEEPAASVESGEASPRGDQGFLDEILRGFPITTEEQRLLVQPVAVLATQGIEGLCIASQSPPHEIGGRLGRKDRAFF